jgi:hypothetical protein
LKNLKLFKFLQNLFQNQSNRNISEKILEKRREAVGRPSSLDREMARDPFTRRAEAVRRRAALTR